MIGVTHGAELPRMLVCFLHAARLCSCAQVFALKTYALALGKPFIYGGTTDAERIQFLHHFQHDSKMVRACARQALR